MPGESQVAITAGGLDPDHVYAAYREGVFPWYDAGYPVLWWSPDPRGIIPLSSFHVSRRLRRTLRAAPFRVSINERFEAVMRACDENRNGSWIHEEMIECYRALHRAGHAHSVEVWDGDRLVGGTYGVAIGGAFAAESKFMRERDASKIALAHLVDHLRYRGFGLLDVQFETGHLAQFGCVSVRRGEYIRRLRLQRDVPASFGTTLLMHRYGTPLPGVTYTPRPGAYAVITNDQNQVAVMRTPSGHYLPGGGADAGETLKEALRREVAEECGRDVRDLQPLGAAGQYVHGRGQNAGSGWIKECTFFRAVFGDPLGHASEPDHTLVWLETERAKACLTHEAHRFAVRRAARA